MGHPTFSSSFQTCGGWRERPRQQRRWQLGYQSWHRNRWRHPMAVGSIRRWSHRGHEQSSRIRKLHRRQLDKNPKHRQWWCLDHQGEEEGKETKMWRGGIWWWFCLMSWIFDSWRLLQHSSWRPSRLEGRKTMLSVEWYLLCVFLKRQRRWDMFGGKDWREWLCAHLARPMSSSSFWCSEKLWFGHCSTPRKPCPRPSLLIVPYSPSLCVSSNKLDWSVFLSELKRID